MSSPKSRGLSMFQLGTRRRKIDFALCFGDLGNAQEGTVGFLKLRAAGMV